MAEYIEREAAIRKAKMANHDTNCSYVDWEQDERTELYINEIPAADVRPVVRGRWKRVDPRSTVVTFRCSECNYYAHVNATNFCPNCGADMRQT